MLRYVRTLLRLAGVLLFASLLTATHSRADNYPIVSVYLGFSSAVNAVALTADGRQAISGGQDNVLRLWDTATGLLLRAFDTQTDAVNAAAFSPDGHQILTGGNDKRLVLWDVVTGETLKSMEGHTGEVRSVAFSQNGLQAVSGSADKTVKLWDLPAGQLMKTFEGHSDEVLSVSFAPDGRRVLSGSKDKTVKLWDVESGQLIKTFEGHAGEVTSVAVSPDGARVISGSRDKTVKLWDLESGQLIKTLEGHSDEVLAVAFAPDGRRILSASKDKSLRLWDPQLGAPVKTFEGHSDAVTSAVLSADGRQAFSGSLDKTLKLWNVEAGRLQSTIDVPSVTFSPNGHRAAGVFGFFLGGSLPGAPDPAKLDGRLQEKDLKRGAPVFLRIFKADLQVELWMKRGARFELFATYPICAWSGQLGPKLREGDHQAPEGFYTIGKGQLNPNSHFHRAFNLGYPNLLDRAYSRTGANLMVHGGCASVGCYAMTDPAIEELWTLVTAALNGGQERIGVHVFPFRMTDARLAAFGWHPWVDFWQELKPAYDVFEETGIPPLISICNKHYAVKRGQAAAASAPELQSVCPANRQNSQHSRAGTP